jgi:hypothetical protein
MKRLVAALCCCLVAGCASSPPAPLDGAYYAAARGNDRNDGCSPQTPFRSLFRALAAASTGPAKTIVVLGTLDIFSERSSNNERVFLIQGTGREEITIRGEASGAEKAVLSGAGSPGRVVLIKGDAVIRFEHIEISGGKTGGEGGGIGAGAGVVLTLGAGAVVTGNTAFAGGGVAVAPGGKLILRGGSVTGNSAEGVGGGIAAAGKNAAVIMEDGELRGNKAGMGGGAAVYEAGVFELNGGTVSGNAARESGGGLIAAIGGTLLVHGGNVTGNSSEGMGGGAAAAGTNTVFIMDGGTITGNTAARGKTAYVVKGGSHDLVRETDAGRGIVLDSSVAGPAGGWETVPAGKRPAVQAEADDSNDDDG